MSWAAWSMLGLLGIALLSSANRHGKPETGKHNFWYTIIAVGIQLGLLAWGGFFASPVSK
jgi:hypothetical protein